MSGWPAPRPPPPSQCSSAPPGRGAGPAGGGLGHDPPEAGLDDVATSVYDVATMTTVSVRELKNRLSEHLRRLEEGETITVTRRGKPVAVMIPAKPREAGLWGGLGRFGAGGFVPWGGGKRRGLAPPIKLP